MADDRTLRGPQDAARINVNEEHEVRYWTAKFGVTREQLIEAVESAGVMANVVAAELKKAERRGG
ncbi:hypothetical protein BH09PSE5_BH09PSE5_27360 [soil metagenome]